MVLSSVPSRASLWFLAAGKMINVLLADDHQSMRKAISAILKDDAEVCLAGEAGSFRETIDLTAEFCPDVVVMEETKVLAKSFGAVTLLDKTKLASELLPYLKQCTQRRSPH
jgi:DNA-binding NarL/FixJ family response regulator